MLLFFRNGDGDVLFRINWAHSWSFFPVCLMWIWYSMVFWYALNVHFIKSLFQSTHGFNQFQFWVIFRPFSLVLEGPSTKKFWIPSRAVTEGEGIQGGGNHFLPTKGKPRGIPGENWQCSAKLDWRQILNFLGPQPLYRMEIHIADLVVWLSNPTLLRAFTRRLERPSQLARPLS